MPLANRQETPASRGRLSRVLLKCACGVGNNGWFGAYVCGAGLANGAGYGSAVSTQVRRAVHATSGGPLRLPAQGHFHHRYYRLVTGIGNGQPSARHPRYL